MSTIWNLGLYFQRQKWDADTTTFVFADTNANTNPNTNPNTNTNANTDTNTDTDIIADTITDTNANVDTDIDDVDEIKIQKTPTNCDDCDCDDMCQIKCVAYSFFSILVGTAIILACV